MLLGIVLPGGIRRLGRPAVDFLGLLAAGGQRPEGVRLVLQFPELVQPLLQGLDLGLQTFPLGLALPQPFQLGAAAGQLGGAPLQGRPPLRQPRPPGPDLFLQLGQGGLGRCQSFEPGEHPLQLRRPAGEGFLLRLAGLLGLEGSLGRCQSGLAGGEGGFVRRQGPPKFGQLLPLAQQSVCLGEGGLLLPEGLSGLFPGLGVLPDQLFQQGGRLLQRELARLCLAQGLRLRGLGRADGGGQGAERPLPQALAPGGQGGGLLLQPVLQELIGGGVEQLAEDGLALLSGGEEQL